MDIAALSTAVMGPPARISPENESNGTHDQIVSGDQIQTCNLSGPNLPAVGGQQPKVVQTAFIHKLYNMLEDPSMQHLITWSETEDSFVMSPSNDFAKVLSQYFKHTNISSFVRQLNMYGFHKVSDVFQTGSPESPLWEFKHGNGNFKRGDLIGLREIKRRASRHALVHRDSYSAPKHSPSQSGAAPESNHVQQIQAHESTEPRLVSIEHTICEMYALLHRIEENSQIVHSRNQYVIEALSRSLQLNQEMSKAILSIIPNSDSQIHRDVANMQVEVQRQAELIRTLDEATESRPYFPNTPPENSSLSPRQEPLEDPRRSQGIAISSRINYNRQPLHSQIPTVQGRIDPVRINNPQLSPGTLRIHPPHPIPSYPYVNPMPHKSPPTNLMRRHTSADIRNVNRWHTNPHSNAARHDLLQRSSSPKRGQVSIKEEQRIRDSFSTYSISNTSRQFNLENTRPTTPPSSLNGLSGDHLNNWSWSSGKDKSGIPGPPTRRGSMAHILNPADTAERNEDHEEDSRGENRKRKRVH
ncbi:putative flocculation suppression protein [Erysiphe neolycopersici]|uniref:Putative flocculation suppression protein n=1 Tax=Erysiphe neolycopersici TaxID=212602 RepID=A0A420HKJ0_9PEZI|nr:putative flocculation suppression protein [Erysiphe neolycopersici]